MHIQGRVMDSIPATLVGTGDQWATFRLVANTMTIRWCHLTDVIVTSLPDNMFGLELCVKLTAEAESYVLPNRLVVDAGSMHAFLEAWGES